MQRVLVIAIGLAAESVSAAPAQDRWDELRHQVLELNRRGNMAGAVRAAEHLLNLADSEFATDRERGLEALMLLSTQYRNQRAYGKEELTRYRELELWFALKAQSPTADGSFPAEADLDLDEVRTHYVPTPLISPAPLALLSNRVDQYSVSGQYKRAESLLLKVPAMRTSSSSADAKASDLHRLGALYLFLGRPADAEPQFRMATELRRKVYGVGHFFVASSLLGLADAMAANGQAASALDALQAALKIIEVEYGEVHPQTAHYLSRLASVLEAAGRRTEAEAARSRAATIRQRFRNAP